MRLRVSEARGLRDLDDEFADLSRLALATFRIRLPLASVSLAAPAVKRGWGNQRDQLLDRLAQRLPQLDQSRSLIRLGVNLAGNPRSQDLVLLLQKFDVLRELVAAGRGDQRQQWVEDFGGHAIVATRY